MIKNMNKLLCLSLIGCALFVGGGATKSVANGLDNGDFARGKSKWLGEGQIVYLKPDGSISAIDDSKPNSFLKPADQQSAADEKPKTTPIIEFKLHSGQFVELAQKFQTEAGTAGMNVQVVYKGSSDFKLNDKAMPFTKSITWGPGSTWYWTAVVFPKVDLFFRLDKRDGHYYKLESVKPGSDWETAKFHWDNIAENQDVTLAILAPPGHGSLWVKSVAVPK